MATVDSVGAITTTSGGTVSNRGLSALSGEDFMKLLIMQLQYQDPLQPMDNQQMLSQISEIRNMEMSYTLTESLRNLTSEQRFASAAAMIGKYVAGTVTDDEGNEYMLAGLVQEVRFTSKGKAVLELDSGQSLPLESVTNVVDPSALGGALSGADASRT